MIVSIKEMLRKLPWPLKFVGLAAVFAAGFYIEAPELYARNLFAALVIFAACLLAVFSMRTFANFYKTGGMHKLMRICILAMPVVISAGVLLGTAQMLIMKKENFEEWMDRLPGAIFISAVALAAAFAIAKSFENADAGTAFVGIQKQKPKGIK